MARKVFLKSAVFYFAYWLLLFRWSIVVGHDQRKGEILSNFLSSTTVQNRNSSRDGKASMFITPKVNVSHSDLQYRDDGRTELEDNDRIKDDDDEDDVINNNDNNDIHPDKSTITDRTKWVTEIFAEAGLRFDLLNSSFINERCRRDYQIYKSHLNNQSIWAIRMYESSQWPTIGLFDGFSVHFGSYDECINAVSHDLTVSGQYCLTESSFNIKGNPTWQLLPSDVITDNPDSDSSVWKAIMMYRLDPVRSDRTKVNWAVCLPATCTANELKLSLNEFLKPLFAKYDLDIAVNVKSELCQTKNSFSQKPTGYYVTVYSMAAIIVLIFSATFYESVKMRSGNYDEKSNKGNLPLRLFTSFSMVTNMRKLVKVDKGHDISVIHFIKIVNILIIIYGHRFIYSVGFPKTDAQTVETLYKEISSIELVHTNVVDVFFMISGFLTYYFGHLPMKKAGEIYYPMSLILRWFRMVPVFCVLAAFIIFVLPYSNNGPLWTERILREADNCRSTWWANLLIVNNFVNVEKQCLVVSWYISTDIQLCIIGGFLLYVMMKYKKCGLILTGLVFLLSAAVTFTVAYVNHYDGVLRLYMSLLTEPRNSEQFNKFYIATYTRVGPYLAGFLTAYLTCILLERGIKFTTKQKLLIATLAIVIGDGFQYYGCFLYVFGRPYIPIENALYAALNRTLLAALFASFILLYMTSGLGFLNKFMQTKMFVPLGRLTYCVFLVNTVIQLYHAASQRTPVPTFSRMTLVWLCLSDIVMSYIYGLLLHLMIESPVTNVTKMLQKKLTKVTIKKKSIEHPAIVNGKINPCINNNSKSNSAENGCLSRSVESGGYCNTNYRHDQDDVKEAVNSRL